VGVRSDSQLCLQDPGATALLAAIEAGDDETSVRLFDAGNLARRRCEELHP
jgi:hypothetical protein